MAIAAFALAFCPAAHAQTWRITPSVGVESTLTSNVDLSPADQRRSDWINQFTPSVRFTESGAHTKLSGNISVPMLVYARTSENNYIAPQADVTGTLEAIDRFFFVDASANVSQQYASPFGPRPTTLANATQNRYTAQTYSVSPYIKGTSVNDLDYELLQKSTWTDAAGISTGLGSNRSYTSEIVGHLIGQPRPGGWAVEYYRSDIKFTDQNSESTEIGRVRAVYQPDPSYRLSVTGGYEVNHFFLTDEQGATYGAGVEWHPNDRTGLNASWEHRFFGPSYQVTFDHRTPLTVWSLKASRDMSSFPQQVANLAPGVDVGSLLDGLFASRITDPAQRQTLVNQLIRDRGLPSQLSGPLALFAQEFSLVESYSATYGILGARNAIFFTAFRTRNEPLPGTEEAALTALLTELTNTTQTGASVVWSHQLEPNLSLSTNATWSRSTENVGAQGTSRQFALSATLSRTLSALTSLYVGARFQRGDSNADIGTNYREFAVLVGLTHTFH